MNKVSRASNVASRVHEPSAAGSRSPALRLQQLSSPAAALGLAVSHLMTKPAFAALGFGAWSRVLVGQVNRGHYRVVFNDQNQVVGFLGWALTNEANAEAWYRGSGTFSDAHAGAGDCVVFNAWAADNGEINRLILHAAREVVSKHRLIYFKRYYPNGSTRPVRMGVNEFVKSHVAHNAARVTVQATVPPPRHGMNAASNGLAATVGHFQGARPGGRQRKFIQEGST